MFPARRFLIDNDLEVTPANLLLAHSAFSGNNPRLARQITARTGNGGVTAAWLAELTEEVADSSAQAELERLMSRLETNLDAFQAQSKSAHKEAADYGSELEQHVTDLEQLQKTGQIVSNLADLAKTMLERTFEPARTRAISSMPETPDALSSAPGPS